MTDRVPGGIPLAAGDGGVGIWNANDVYTWTNYIMKYLCIEANDKNLFHALEFALSHTMIALKSTYTNETKKENAISNRNEDYHILVEYCLNNLAQKTILENTQLTDSADGMTYSVYQRTEVLTALCPRIRTEPDKMHDIDILLWDYRNHNHI